MKQKNDFLKFNSGIVNIYASVNIADVGDKPNFQLKHRWKLRFENKTVGMQRFYIAQQSDTELSRLVQVPQQLGINLHDVATIDGISYDIVQVQHKYDTKPFSTLLSLERIVTKL